MGYLLATCEHREHWGTARLPERHMHGCPCKRAGVDAKDNRPRGQHPAASEDPHGPDPAPIPGGFRGAVDYRALSIASTEEGRKLAQVVSRSVFATPGFLPAPFVRSLALRQERRPGTPSIRNEWRRGLGNFHAQPTIQWKLWVVRSVRPRRPLRSLLSFLERHFPLLSLGAELN